MYTIFGSNGFIGSELVSYLKKNKYKVFKPKKNQQRFSKNLGHIIYCVGSDDWKKYPKKGFDSNLGHLKEILFNCKFQSFLFLSSSRVYVNNKISYTKENNFVNVDSSNLNDYYNLLKLTSEAICLSQNKKNIKVIRISNVLGKNFMSPLVLPSLIRDAIKNSKIKILINKNSTKDYISINDVLYLIIKIIKSGKKNLYNVASGKNIKLIDIAKIIQKETGCKIILKNQSIKVLEPKISIQRIKKEFKYIPDQNIGLEIKLIVKEFKKSFKRK